MAVCLCLCVRTFLLPERQSFYVFPPLANSVLTHSFCSDTHSFLELSFTGLQSSPPLPSNIKQRMYSMNRGDQKNLLKSGKQICILKKGVQLHSARTRCQNVFTQRFVQIRDVMPHRLLRESSMSRSDHSVWEIVRYIRVKHYADLSGFKWRAGSTVH